MKKRGSKETQEQNRKEVIRLLRLKNGKWTQEKVALNLGISRNAVWKIWQKHKRTYLKKIVSKKRGLKDGLKFKKKHAVEILNYLKQNRLNNEDFWTVTAVQKLIQERYFIDLSKSQTTRHLRVWRCCSSIKQIKELKNFGKREEDSTPLFFITKNRLPYSGAKNGTNLLTTGRPTSCLSAVNGKGLLFFQIIRGFINAKIVESFILKINEMSKPKPGFILQQELKSEQLVNWGLEAQISLTFPGNQKDFKSATKVSLKDSTPEHVINQKAPRRKKVVKRFVTDQEADSFYQNIYEFERPEIETNASKLKKNKK